MPKFASQIDTLKIPVKGLTPESGASFPSSPSEGQMFHRTDLKMFYVYLNGGWKQCDNQGVAAASHIHAIADVTGLQAALDGKSATGHTHTIADVTGLQAALDGKSPTGHSHTIANVTGLQTALDAKASITYVDNLAQGIVVKESVRAATTGSNITLSGLQTVDSVSLAANNRVLVKDQTTKHQNGVYLAQSGAWTRAADFDEGSDVKSGAFVFVQEGTMNAETGWVMTTDTATGSPYFGSTSIEFAQFTGIGSFEAGYGLRRMDGRLDVGGTSGRISVTADAVDIASTYIGQTSITRLGTITVGTWSADTIALDKGGTGSTTAAGARANLGVGHSTWINLPALTAGVWTTIYSATTVNYCHVSITDSSGEEVYLDVRRTGGYIQVRSDVAYAASALNAYLTVQ